MQHRIRPIVGQFVFQNASRDQDPRQQAHEHIGGHGVAQHHALQTAAAAKQNKHIIYGRKYALARRP